MITNSTEKKGGKKPNYTVMRELVDYIDDADLIDASFSRSPFT